VSDSSLHGLMAEFDTPGEIVRSARSAREAGYRNMDAYSPFPVEGLAEAVGMPASRIPLLVLLGGAAGCIGGFFMQYYAAVIAYPLNIGGRPLNSWPSFIPITFELTILCAGLTAVIGMLVLNGFPKPYNPVFNAERFEHATQDTFFLCIESSDPKFSREETGRFLESLHPRGVYAVEQ